MRQPRDSQRAKVYAAEDAAFGAWWNLPTSPMRGIEFASLEEIDAYLVKLTGWAWFKRRWGKHVYVRHSNALGRNVTTWRTEPGRGGANCHDHRLRFGVKARCERVVLHEFAHHIQHRMFGRYSTAGHGWEFCSIYLELIEYAWGKEWADKLKAEFKARKVRYTQPRKRAPLSEEQRQVLRDRLAAARAARSA